MPSFSLSHATSSISLHSLRNSSKTRSDPPPEDALPFYTTTPQTATEQANALALRNLMYFMLASDYLFLESSGQPTVRSTWTRCDGQAPHPPKPTHSWWCKAYREVDWKRWINAAELIEMDRLGVVQLCRPLREELRLPKTGGSVVIELACRSRDPPPQYNVGMPTTSGRTKRSPTSRKGKEAEAQTFYDTYIHLPARALGIPVAIVEAYIWHSFHSNYRCSDRQNLKWRPAYCTVDGWDKGALRERLMVDAEVVVPAVISSVQLREKCVSIIDQAAELWLKERTVGFEGRSSDEEKVLQLSRLPSATAPSGDPATDVASAASRKFFRRRRMSFARARVQLFKEEARVSATGGFESSRCCGNGDGGGSQNTCQVAIRRREGGRVCVDPVERYEDFPSGARLFAASAVFF